MSQPYIGEIILFAGNFAPRGWALCQGQILSIAQNTALFSILGTTYGGNGQTTFALPDLRGRAPIGQGQGPGLQNYVLGEMAGSENVSLISTEMPQHTHLLQANSAGGSETAPTNNVIAAVSDPNSGSLFSAFAPAASVNTTMAPQAVGLAGGSQPHNNMQPFLCLNYIIALEGIFPSRN